MYTILRSKCSGMTEEAIKFAQELIQNQSICAHEQQVAERTMEEMKKLGYDTVERDDAGNVIGIIWGREDAPTVVLNSHLDTITPCEREWKMPMFAGTSTNGKIYGVGAADCKGGVAAQVYAGGLLKRSLLPLNGNLVVAATVMEENGLSVGVRELLDKSLPGYGLKPDFFILGEPTDLGIYYGHDGRVELDILVEGMDPLAVNDAADSLATKLRKAGNGFEHNTSLVSEMEVSPSQYENTAACRRAKIHVEKRLHSEEDGSGIITWAKQQGQELLGTDTTVAVEAKVVVDEQLMGNGRRRTVKHIAHAWETNPFDPLLERSRQILAAAGCEVRTGKWQLNRLGMGTAGGVIANEYGFPVIGYGPGREDQAHTPGEYVEISNLTECVYGSAAIVHGLIGIPVYGWTADEI